MSKKHYIVFADVLNKTRPPKYGDCYGIWLNIVAKISAELAADNHRFDKETFYAACGVINES